eukprot:5218183-Amphidinium_carterae.1
MPGIDSSAWQAASHSHPSIQCMSPMLKQTMTVSTSLHKGQAKQPDKASDTLCKHSATDSPIRNEGIVGIVYKDTTLQQQVIQSLLRYEPVKAMSGGP